MLYPGCDPESTEPGVPCSHLVCSVQCTLGNFGATGRHFRSKNTYMQYLEDLGVFKAGLRGVLTSTYTVSIKAGFC